MFPQPHNPKTMSLEISNLLSHASATWAETDPRWRVVLTLAAVFTISLLVKRVVSGSVRLPPGPRGLPLLGSLPFLDPELHTHFADLGRAYGPVAKLWLGNKLGVLITSPAAASEVLKLQDVTFANRDVPEAGLAATYGGHDIVWTPYGPEWRMLRKVCVLKMLSNTTLDAVYALRRAELRKTVGHLYSRVGSPVDVGERMFLTVLNVITSMMWGGTVEGEERDGLGAEFRHAVSEMTAMLGTPNVSDFYPTLARFDLQGVRRRVEVVAGKLDAIFEKMIDQRVKMDGQDSSDGCGGARGSKDFLQFLLKLKDEGGADAKTPFTMTHLKSLLMDMVVGGSDTSSNSVEFAMAEIMNKPEIMRKIHQELDSVVGRDKTVEEHHIPKLPYLLAVMKESLRLHPALPLLVPHSPSETCTVSGYTIPKGSRIFVNVWAIQRDPTLWPDPLEFDPDRFLGGNDKKFDFSGSDFSYFPFGSGRRICAGVAMAERMFLFSLATLLHSFEWKVAEGERVDLTERFGIVLKLRNPLVVVPTPRLSDPGLYE